MNNEQECKCAQFEALQKHGKKICKYLDKNNIEPVDGMFILVNILISVGIDADAISECAYELEEIQMNDEFEGEENDGY